MTARLNRSTLALPLVMASLALAACTVEEGPAPAYPQQPVYTQPYANTPTEVVAEQPPPPPPPPAPEAIPVAPGPDFVWIGGYHAWNGRGYDWRNGHYERRPHEHARHEPAHWEHRGNHQVWVEGRWN